MLEEFTIKINQEDKDRFVLKLEMKKSYQFTFNFVNKYSRYENVRRMKYFIVIVVEGDVAEPSYLWMIEEKFKNCIR